MVIVEVLFERKYSQVGLGVETLELRVTAHLHNPKTIRSHQISVSSRGDDVDKSLRQVHRQKAELMGYLRVELLDLGFCQADIDKAWNHFYGDWEE